MDPPNAIDPGMWARLMGYAGALSPIGSAHAGGVQAPDSPEARQAAIAAAAAQMNNGGPGAQPPGPQGPVTPPGITAVNPPFPQNVHAAVPGGDPRAYDSMINRMMPNSPPMGPPPPPTAPPLAQQPQAVPLASTPLPPARPAAIDPRMRGEVPPAIQPGWDTISRPNQNPGTGGGMLGGALAGPRGNGGPDPMGVFNFASLFGGGQPAAPAAAPKAKIDVGKIPADMRAEVPPSKRSKVKSDMGPLQKGWTWGGKDYNPDLYR